MPARHASACKRQRLGNFFRDYPLRPVFPETHELAKVAKYTWRRVPAEQSCLTFVNVLFTIRIMIETFAAPETERFFVTGKSRRLPPAILRRAAMRLQQLDGAARIEDLRLPPSNRLEALVHDRAGQWSIRINEQRRVCFRFKNGDAYDVEVVDYH